MNLKNIVLSLAFLYGCGSNSRNSGLEGNCPDMSKVHDSSKDEYNMKDKDDSSKDKYDMDSKDSKDNNPDLEGNCPDMGLEGRLDSGLDAGEDMGGDMSGDVGVSYPIAALNCEDDLNCTLEDGVPVYRLRRGIGHCWDATPSEAGSGRELAEYRIYLGFPDFPDFYIWNGGPDVCGFYDVTNAEYGLPDGFPAELEVIDDIGDTAMLSIRNLVTD